MHDRELIRKNAESSTQRIGCAAWRLFLLLVWAAWWGGLCFYAVVVVPIGTELIGSVEQGFITQRVTQSDKRCQKATKGVKDKRSGTIVLDLFRSSE